MHHSMQMTLLKSVLRGLDAVSHNSLHTPTNFVFICSFQFAVHFCSNSMWFASQNAKTGKYHSHDIMYPWLKEVFVLKKFQIQGWVTKTKFEIRKRSDHGLIKLPWDFCFSINLETKDGVHHCIVSLLPLQIIVNISLNIPFSYKLFLSAC